MPRFSTCNDVERAPGEVFEHVCDLSRWPSFKGWGPVPGIAEASLARGAAMGPGARVRVRNTDGSVHHEVVEAFERGRLYVLRMELEPPASRVLETITEEVVLEPLPAGGTRVIRTFTLTPRSALAAPVAWLASACLRRAVAAHDRAVASELRSGSRDGRSRASGA